MSSSNIVHRGQGSRGAIRAVEPLQSDAPERPGDPIESIRCAFRPAGADFYCWKYGVWYNLMDCCYRHEKRTFDGCADCGQGRGNLKQNIDRYRVLFLKPRPSHSP